jgi:energy-converting hydrogenase Eha subunit A
MPVVIPGERIYFGAVGLLALWVGIWGYFIPDKVDMAIPWLVPPLHARCLGAMYLSGTTFMIGGILARYYAEVKVMLRVIPIWTGMLFVVSLFYLSEFDYSRTQVWIWFGAYIIYPLIALWLIWKYRNLNERLTGPSLPDWVRGYLLIQGILVTALALVLLLAPDFMVSVWPWNITRLLAQIYSAPFLAYGISSIMISRLGTWAEIRVVVTATFVFALGVLLASFIHRALFSASNLSTWLWFGGFLVATIVLGLLTVRAIQTKRATT